MKMINRETILEILQPIASDEMCVPDSLGIGGLRIIAGVVGSVRLYIDDNLFKTIAVDTMLAYNFPEEDCRKLNKLGWFIKDEYLVIQL